MEGQMGCLALVFVSQRGKGRLKVVRNEGTT